MFGMFSHRLTGRLRTHHWMRRQRMASCSTVPRLCLHHALHRADTPTIAPAVWQVPMALVSLIDGERLFFKSVAGTDCRQGALRAARTTCGTHALLL